MYDNTKLEKAVDGWLKTNCKVGYGQEYSGALQRDFENYCRETGALQASPGVVAFGKQLNQRGFGRKRVTGLQYVTGIELLNPVHVPERRQARTIEHGEELEVERLKRAKKARRKIKKVAAETTNADAVRARMQQETKDRNIRAGETND